MKAEEMLIELWEISTRERYYQTGKLTLPITNYFAPFPPFHGPCMNAAPPWEFSSKTEGLGKGASLKKRRQKNE